MLSNNLKKAFCDTKENNNINEHNTHCYVIKLG